MADSDIPDWAKDDEDVPAWARDTTATAVAPSQLSELTPEAIATAAGHPGKAELLARKAKAAVAAGSAETLSKIFGFGQNVVEPLTPAGLLNQPNRVAASLGANVDPNAFKEGVPTINLPTAQEVRPGLVAGTAAGVYNTIAKTLSGLTTPESIVTMPAAAASPLVRAAFVGQIVKDLPEQAKQAVETFRDPNATIAEKTEAVGTPLVSSLMATGLTFPEATKAATKAITDRLTIPESIQPKTQEVPNASEIGKAKAVYGSLRSLAGEGERQVPAQEGGQGVQPQAEIPLDLQPANAVPPELRQGIFPEPPKPTEAVPKTSPEASEAPKAPEPAPTEKTSPEASQTPKTTASDILKMTPDELVTWVRDAKNKWGFEKSKEIAATVKPEEVADIAKERDSLRQKSEVLHVEAQEASAKGDTKTALSKLNEAGPIYIKAQSLNEILQDHNAQSEAPGQVTPKVVGTAPVETIPAGSPLPAGVGDMGGARHTPSNEPSARETYGIAERVRARAARQGEGPDVPPGQGISPQDSVEHGMELLNQGADPEQALANFEKTKRFSSDDMALVRAKGFQLRQRQINTEQDYGTDSDQYRQETQIRDDWERRSKAMQTEWHKSGQAQQGETDIDTGTFSGLRNAYFDATGKEFTEPQKAKARKIAAEVADAQGKTDAAKKELGDAIKSKPEPSQDPQEVAARRALAAAQEVADRAKKMADEAAKAEVSSQKPESDADAKALQAAHTQHQEAAVRLAEAEAKRRVASTVRDKQTADVQVKAAKKALDSAAEVVRKEAARVAKKQKESGSAEAARNKAVAKIASERARKALEAAQKTVRDNARRLADLENKRRVQQADIKNLLWKMVKDSFDKGDDDFDGVRHKIAIETGMPVEKVTELLSQDKSFKRMSDEMYRRMSDLRRFKDEARNWVKNQQTPGWLQTLRNIPKAFFASVTAFHGTVPMITHAGLNLFNPEAWSRWFPKFAEQFKMVGSKAYHERAIQDLLRDPNYITARRAGLANDPYRYSDDYQNAAMKTFFRTLGVANRGFDALKTFRQARFNQEWSKAPKSLQTPEYAEWLAKGVNHATGVTKASFGGLNEAVSVVGFSPRMEASRWAWATVDPLRAGKIFVNWRNESPAARTFAMSQLKEKAYVVGTLYGLLALNQGILSATGSKQKVNGIPKSLGGAGFDPKKSDFLAFKVAGHNVGIISPLARMAGLFANLYHAAVQQRTAYERSKGTRFEQEVWDLGEYGRGKLSPFAGTVVDLAAQSDLMKRPLPFATEREPRYLRRKGVTPYTWPDYVTEKLAPIPVEEAIREVWTDQGMPEKDQHALLNALLTGAIAGTTGARISKDTSVQSAPTPDTSVPAWAK